MSQRLSDTTKWFWYLLVLHAGYLWGPSRSVTVRTPPNNPATVEAQAKFFQDFFSVQLSPYKIEFGHVCEDPNTWEQRYEKKDFKNHRDMGKVRWGDKKGGYGEHYWDLNHAGHSDDNNGNDDYGRNYDDGSYHEDDNNHHNNDQYDEPSEQEPNYDTEESDTEKAINEESSRAKRAHPRVRFDRKPYKGIESHEEESKPRKQSRKNKEQLQASPTEDVEKYNEEEESDEEYKAPVKQTKQKERQQHHRQREQNKEDYQQPREQKPQKNQVVLVVTQKEKDSDNQPTQYAPKRQPEVTNYVPYEGGAGVRQHQPSEAHAATALPRLFLEASTGHVVDRATGQAYMLQPIANRNYN